ncbi:MAG TPA: hypothetical protein VH044_17615 [Polyangiaceae bacterium]|jgi:hypothetical protein|nr:hypothetical protein [Polyangiaceae bacterium]
MISVKGKNAEAAFVKQMIAGTQKHYPNGGASIPVDGVSYTVTALTQLMQDFVDQRDAVESAKAATKSKVATERARAPAQLVVIRGFEQVVRGSFGNAADVLADFGLAPTKVRTPMTAEQKAVAAAKRAATRSARHTMGKNQKKDVKGAIKATLVVTPLDGSTPTGTGTPASTTAAGTTPPVATPTGGTGSAPGGGTPSGGTTTHA